MTRHELVSRAMSVVGLALLLHFVIVVSTTLAQQQQQKGVLSVRGSMTGGYFPGEIVGHHHHHQQQQQQGILHNYLGQSVHGETSVHFGGGGGENLFQTENSTVVTAQVGSKTFLPCAVRGGGSGSSGVASWIRRRDYTLLTVGMGTYVNDGRFVVVHNRVAQSWELHIKSVRESDQGLYECQISTHPPASVFIRLKVVEASAAILGEPDKHVRSGSRFELVCVLRDSTEPPVYVFWYHNDRMINYDNLRGVVVNRDPDKSILTILQAGKSHSGNYSCVPSNARPSSISVHILNGEKPAAMQHGSSSGGRKNQQSLIFPVFLTLPILILLSNSCGTQIFTNSHNGVSFKNR